MFQKIELIAIMFKKLREKMRLTITLFFFQSFAYSLSGKKIVAPKYSAALLATSGLIETDWQFILNDKWRESFDLMNMGQYRESVKIRESILSEIDQKFKSDGIPRAYHSGFLSGFGHPGVLAAHQAGCKLGILDNKEKYLVSPNENLLNVNPYLQAVCKNLPMFAPTSNWTALPMFWHLVEMLEMHRTHHSYLDQYVSIQKIFNKWTTEFKNQPIVKLEEKYLDFCMKKLKELGLANNQEFVALHIRENNNVDDPRNVNVLGYQKVIDEIIEMGLTVIRFGAGKMTPFNTVPGLIDLNTDTPENRYIHYGVMKLASLFIVTNSGPSLVALTLGTPVLMTNANHISLQFDKTNHWVMPKKFIDLKHSQVIPLGKVISSNLGYCLLNQTKLAKYFGVGTIENTPKEMANSAREILGLLLNKKNINEKNPLLDFYQSNQSILTPKIPSGFLEFLPL